MNNERNYLLDAVDRLTLNHITKVMQTKELEHRDAEGELINAIDIACITDVDHDPLLLHLRNAIAGGIGSHAGSSSARERIPLDAGALELFDSIVHTINAWYREVPGHREDRTIDGRLRDWYVDYENRRRAGKVSDSTANITTRIVEGWARSIEAMFDPPTVFEITNLVDGHNVPVPCPMCGEPRAFNPKNGDVMSALIIEYRNLGVETLDKATGLCRACGEVWRGRHGVRELRWAIDHADTPGISDTEKAS